MKMKALRKKSRNEARWSYPLKTLNLNSSTTRQAPLAGATFSTAQLVINTRLAAVGMRSSVRTPFPEHLRGTFCLKLEVNSSTAAPRPGRGQGEEDWVSAAHPQPVFSGQDRSWWNVAMCGPGQRRACQRGLDWKGAALGHVPEAPSSDPELRPPPLRQAGPCSRPHHRRESREGPGLRARSVKAEVGSFSKPPSFPQGCGGHHRGVKEGDVIKSGTRRGFVEVSVLPGPDRHEGPRGACPLQPPSPPSQGAVGSPGLTVWRPSCTRPHSSRPGPLAESTAAHPHLSCCLSPSAEASRPPRSSPAEGLGGLQGGLGGTWHVLSLG